ncbi:hypothetical protein GCM10007071_30950 [Marinobacter zhanjiangensis]|uniref:Uncharacterized protein n=1 Tax=Marinobacter zhanjiangensis TaxID=578215 RepID=A0ABQ3B9D9_9GAMM|nr:hypothetical protein GCM10007071_30950 [Marinobacter zhanjiangensis]
MAVRPAWANRGAAMAPRNGSSTTSDSVIATSFVRSSDRWRDRSPVLALKSCYYPLGTVLQSRVDGNNALIGQLRVGPENRAGDR